MEKVAKCHRSAEGDGKGRQSQGLGCMRNVHPRHIYAFSVTDLLRADRRQGVSRKRGTGRVQEMAPLLAIWTFSPKQHFGLLCRSVEELGVPRVTRSASSYQSITILLKVGQEEA